MPELRLQVSQSFIDDMNKRLKRIHDNEAYSITLTNIGREALVRFQWTVEQIDEGKAVVATFKDKKELFQLGTPAIPARAPKK